MEQRMCKCGLQAELKTSWTDNNPAMRFFHCSKDAKPCSYFEFIDPKPTLMQRNYIVKLRRERDALEAELRIKKWECNELKESEEVAWDKAGRIIVENHEMEDELKILKEEMKRLKAKCWWKNLVLCVLVMWLVVVVV
ncbi:uncharacterized protein LOC130990466 [Salvia miltiorrhiza]|uniref:uncharacterized protein LOC130990466 n=1 Tax=Salvia miltiorrhiza TaxID=226208 RepID=UPI0025ABDCCF|nr:uncharacterized protein LOC130990466 [Salvia miltiorrhiza]